MLIDLKTFGKKGNYGVYRFKFLRLAHLIKRRVTRHLMFIHEPLTLNNLRIIIHINLHINLHIIRHDNIMAITQNIYAQSTVSMTDLRRASITDIVSDSPVAVLNHNKPAAYLLSADYYEFLLDQVENIELSKIVKARRGGKAVKVSLDDL